MEIHMRSQQLILQCYAEKAGDQWQAICLDLNLAAQGNSCDEARMKLDAQIMEYVNDALAGEDQQYAANLLRRPAPLRFRLKYRAYKLLGRLHTAKAGFSPFYRTLPLIPVNT